MTKDFKPLPVMPTPSKTKLTRPSDLLPSNATLNNPAIDVMTDLNHKEAVTVDPNLSLDAAEGRMRNSRIRMLFVLNETGDLLGLVTLSDIKGMRPMQFQQAMGVSRSDVLVRDIMTPTSKLETLALTDVVQSCVGDVIQTLKSTGRQHALVIENTSTGPAIRGIFSARQVGRQLGVQIDTSGIALTFAELEVALGH